MPNLLREFDLQYWQMRAALGYPTPHRIEARWPKGMNAGNPYKCGKCQAHRTHPGVNIAADILWAHDNCEPHDFEDVIRRARLAFEEVGVSAPSKEDGNEG